MGARRTRHAQQHHLDTRRPRRHGVRRRRAGSRARRGAGTFLGIRPSGTGDITDSAKVWHRGGEEFNRTISTASIRDGILYIADLSGFLYALDAKTGEHFWTHDTFAAVWGSAFVADGKVYIGDEDGDVVVLKAGKETEELAEMNMGASVYTTPVAKDGVLFVLSRNSLFAIQEGASGAGG